MANEFKVKKGLIVTGASGGTVVDVQGSQGQLFSVTDDLSGSIFAVSDISGVPILDVNSSGISYFDGSLGIGTANPSRQLEVVSSSGIVTVLTSTTGGSYISMEDSATTSDSQVRFGAIGDNAIIKSGGTTALTLSSSQNATFAGDVTVEGSYLKILNHTGSYEGAATDYLYVGGSGLDGSNGAIYLGNAGDDTGYGWRFFYLGSGSGNGNKLIIRSENAGSGVDALSFTQDGNSTFATKAFSAATSSGDASSTLTTKGYVDSLITGATIYRGAWQAGISATSSAATTASTTLTVTAAILDAGGETPDLVGAVVTGEGITGIVKVASVTSSTVYVLDTAITATATAYIFSPIYGAPSLDGVTQTSGYYYICSEAGSATPNGANSEPNTWNVGDWCIYNDVSGTGQWQKIDNSSVLSGAGTGQTVALWEGPSSVSDSDTLGNAPITVSGNDTIFAGTVEAATYYKSSGTSAVLGTNASGEVLLRPTSSISSTAQSSFTTTLATIGTEATFAGPITAEFATSSAMLNLYNTTNGGGSTIRFSDQATQTQVGDITFYHSDGSSQGGGASWHFTSQPDTVLVVGSSTVTGRFVAKSAGSATEVDYGFYDDVNTGMYRAGADTLAFSTAGTERMRINSAGAIKFNAYGAGTLVTDASGNITVSSGGGAGGPYLPLTGGTLTGGLIGTTVKYNTQLSTNDLMGQKAFIGISSGQGAQKFKIYKNTDTTDGYARLKIDRAFDYGNSDQMVQEAIFQRRNTTKRFVFRYDGDIATTDDVYLEVYELSNGQVEIWLCADDYAQSVVEVISNPGTSEIFTSPSAGTPTGTLIHSSNPDTETPNWNSHQGAVTATTFSGDLNGTINTATTGATQTAGNNSTLIATTAFVTAAVAAAPQGDITGSGTAGYIPKWSTTSALADSSALYNGTSGLLNINNTFSGSPTGSSGSPDLWITGSVTDSQAVVALMNAKTTSTANQVNGDIEFGTKDDGSAGYVSARIRGIQTSASGTGTAGRGELQFATNGGNTGASPETRMVIDYTGKVGIGTTSPVAALNIGNNGNIRIDGNASGGGIYASSNGSNNTFSLTRQDGVNVGDLSISGYSGVGITGGRSDSPATSGYSFYVKNGGNVGIGTTSPGAKLEVEGDATGDDTPQLIVASGGADNNAIIHFTDDAGSQVNAIGALEGNTLTLASQNELVFKTNTSSILGTTDTRMIIDTNGKVGIGTTNPSTNLQVIGTVRADVFGVQDDSTNPSGNTSTRVTSPAGATYDDQNNTASTGVLSVIFPTVAASTMLSFTLRVFDYANNESFDVNVAGYWYGSGLWTNTSVRIESQGNVERNFNVRFGKNNTTNKGWVGVGETTTNWSYVKFAVLNFQAAHVNDDLERWNDLWDTAVLTSLTGYTTLVTKNNNQVNNWARNGENLYYGSGSGNVGIGTTSPGAKLDVQGTQGQLFSVTDDLSGDIFSVADISGVPILNVNSSGLVTVDGTSYFNGNVGIGTNTPATSAKLTVMGNQTFGIPGNGSNTDGRFISIEGNADSGGEGSGRIFFTEHNSTTASMDAYGMSIGYRGGATSIVGASGETWTGLSQIGNGEWGMWGHNASNVGSLIMHGDRAATYVDFSGNNIQGIQDAYVADQIIHTGDTNTYMQFHAADQWRVVTGGSERLEVNNSAVTVNACPLIVNEEVGIGTTTPNTKLDVISGTNNGIRISATDTTSNWRDISIRSYVTQAQAAALTDHTHFFTTNPSGQSDPAFQRYGGTVIQCRDDGNSNFAIRIGNGNGHATALNINASGVTTFNNTVTATNFILSSDERKKTKIKDLTCDNINVNWKSFELKEDGGEYRTGVIAQELEQSHPEFVKTDDEGFKSVKYIDLLIAKIAELEARLEKAGI
jgi:hypothetical protein